MQVNLLDSRIKEFFKILGWPLFFILLSINIFKGPNNSVIKTKIIVPAISAKLETKKPESKPLEIKKIQNPIKSKEGIVYVQNPLNKILLEENKKLKSDFSKLKNDTLKQKAYDKAVELNHFSSKFEDDNLLLNIDGIVQGEVHEITPSYTIKSRELAVDVKQKETYLRVFIGTGIGVNKALDRGLYKFDLDFMNRKGDIFSAEYLRVNGQDFGLIGIKKSIINLKR